MTLEQVYAAIAVEEWVDLPAGWLQGRTLYGGLAAAMMMQKAVLSINDPAKHLLSTSVIFVGPVQQRPVRLTAEILREGNPSLRLKFACGRMMQCRVSC